MASFSRFRRIRDILYSKKYLGITNVCTTCGLLCLGDVLMQGLEVGYNKIADNGEKTSIDYQRTGRVGQVGIPSGIVNHVWYTNLDKFLPGRSKRFILKKVLLDTTIAGPCFLTIYFYGMALTEGKSHAESWQALKTAFIPVFCADVCYWPLIQACNFYIIPSKYRVLTISICQLVWNSFLSFMKHLGLNKLSDNEETEDDNETLSQGNETLTKIKLAANPAVALCDS